MKVCRSCRQELPIEKFKLDKKYNSCRPDCYPCVYANNKDAVLTRANEWRKNNKDRIRMNNYLREYGVSLDWYNEQLSKQEGRCAICSADNPRSSRVKHFSIDHNHKTGQVRKLLCFPCNAAIGYLQDNPQLARTLAAYLESYEL